MASKLRQNNFTVGDACEYRYRWNMAGTGTADLRVKTAYIGAFHVRLMAAHWSNPYMLYYDGFISMSVYSAGPIGTVGNGNYSTYDIRSRTSSQQGSWTVSRVSDGNNNYGFTSTILRIAKNAGNYNGGMACWVSIQQPWYEEMYTLSFS
jgi:hypothetical protein